MAILKQHYPKVSLHAAVMLYTQQSVLIQLGMFIRVVTVAKVNLAKEFTAAVLLDVNTHIIL